MLSPTISRDEAIAELSCDAARLTYTWLIPHADNLGRLPGEPQWVKATIIPKTKATVGQVARWLEEMNRLKLIVWYRVGSGQFIYLTGWPKHQTLVGNMKRTSDLPAPPDVDTAFERRSNEVHTPYERRITEEKRREEKNQEQAKPNSSSDGTDQSPGHDTSGLAGDKSPQVNDLKLPGPSPEARTGTGMQPIGPVLDAFVPQLESAQTPALRLIQGSPAGVCTVSDSKRATSLTDSERAIERDRQIAEAERQGLVRRDGDRWVEPRAGEE